MKLYATRSPPLALLIAGIAGVERLRPMQILFLSASLAVWLSYRRRSVRGSAEPAVIDARN
ncbi:hypothetical protein J19TS2_02340 [Cohnella xylanilytica]|nr:hypothetical protein J19TS2_02340 [Cohnella xylanilytica]